MSYVALLVWPYAPDPGGGVEQPVGSASGSGQQDVSDEGQAVKEVVGQRRQEPTSFEPAHPLPAFPLAPSPSPPPPSPPLPAHPTQSTTVGQLAKELIEDGSLAALAQLRRKAEDVEAYQAYLHKLKSEYASTVDYLMITVFKAQRTVLTGGKVAAVAPAWVACPDQAPVIVWRLNDFPYWFEPGIQHWVLWSSRPLPHQAVLDEVAGHWPGSQCLHWVNPVQLQSVTAPIKGKGKAARAKAKPAPQPGRWLDRDCNAALNMQRIGESRWRPLELCYWPDQGALPAKGKEYPGLGYKRVRDKPPKAPEQQQQPAEAHPAPPPASLVLPLPSLPSPAPPPPSPAPPPASLALPLPSLPSPAPTPPRHAPPLPALPHPLPALCCPSPPCPALPHPHPALPHPLPALPHPLPALRAPPLPSLPSPAPPPPSLALPLPSLPSPAPPPPCPAPPPASPAPPHPSPAPPPPSLALPLTALPCPALPVGVWQCSLQVAAGCRCASVHEQQQHY
ncbi:hypothetical protein QJQ45_028033 [Haematococcus lacustris]|nr:hypothetical protein QJQ45_028033 [Haematococcus lacustris]